MFFATLKTVAGQVLMLYLISLIGFVTDKLGVFRQADAKRVIDLLFNIVLPIAIIYTFMTMAYTPDHVRGILLAFVCAFATHLVGGVLGQLCFRHRSPMERGVYRYGMLFSNASFLALQLWFMMLGIAVSQLVHRVRSVVAYTLGAVFGLFAVGLIGALIGEEKFRYASPFKYIDYLAYVSEGTIDAQYWLVGGLMALAMLVGGYMLYTHRDKKAVA